MGSRSDVADIPMTGRRWTEFSLYLKAAAVSEVELADPEVIRLPQYSDRVAGELPVSAYERQVLNRRLGHQEPVERVLVMIGEAVGSEGVL